MAVGELIQAGLGIGQNIKANRLQREADKLPAPGMYDPQQTAFLDLIQRRRKQIQTGTDSATTQARDLVKSNIAKLSSDVFKSGAEGNVIRQLISDLTRSAGQQISNVASAQSGAVNSLLGMEGSQTNAMADRAKDIQWWKKIQKMREAAELKTTANQNIGASVAALAGKEKEAMDVAKTLLMGA